MHGKVKKLTSALLRPGGRTQDVANSQYTPYGLWNHFWNFNFMYFKSRK